MRIYTYIYIYIYVYIYTYTYIYIYIYIRRPLQSVERVRLHFLAYNIQSLSNSHPSKQGPTEDISPASQGSQAAEIEESYPPGTQAAGIQDLGARMLKSRDLIILSSSIGDLLARNSLPQAATGCQGSGPRIQQISLNRASRLHRSAKWLSWVPCLSQLSPNAPTSLQGPSQMRPQVTQCQICHQANTKKASKHPGIQASGPRGRRQRR